MQMATTGFWLSEKNTSTGQGRQGPPCSEAAQSMFRQTSIRNCLTCYYRLLETGTPVPWITVPVLHYTESEKCCFAPNIQFKPSLMQVKLPSMDTVNDQSPPSILFYCLCFFKRGNKFNIFLLYQALWTSFSCSSLDFLQIMSLSFPKHLELGTVLAVLSSDE